MTHSIESMLSAFEIGQINGSGSTGKLWYGSQNGKPIETFSPVDGISVALVYEASQEDYEKIIVSAQNAFLFWRKVPSPRRGELILHFGKKLEENKSDLGQLVSYEMGKSLQEGLGEVQEMIDICNFAQGLSRQIGGPCLPSERPMHQMMEQYHPLGIVGIISAFNFPIAVWGWNVALALVCGNVCIWKPSEKTPLSAIACQKLIAEVLSLNGYPEGISNLLLGGHSIGEFLTKDQRVQLVSATGSVQMGRSVAVAVANRLGRSLLELGGNNAIILSEKADIDLMLTGIVFGAVGTAGQRCTSTRRLIIHESIYNTVIVKLKAIYEKLKIGDPLDERNHVGPLIDKEAVKKFLMAIQTAILQGAKVLVEGLILEEFASGCYVKPAILEVESHYPIVAQETFAPLLYIMKYSQIEEAISIQNSVPQGLSSAIMTLDIREAGLFMSAEGSDCGIANVNIGTSGAEIGGAFGGEKETGGGRESGSDSWKNYMRRQTNTINYGWQLPLAQGIKFNV